MSGRVQVEDHPDGLRLVSLDNPGKKNALSVEMIGQLAEAFDPQSSRQVRAYLVRSASGGVFCSGYDLSVLTPTDDPTRMPDQHVVDVMKRVREHPAPSVALVEGGAFGAGCELAASCDFRVGSPGAVFCMPPSRIGLVYAPEGLWRLATLVGAPFAELMFLTGRKIGAADALARGLLQELHPTGAAQAALALSQELVLGAPLAVRGMKRSFAVLSRERPTQTERAELDELRRQAYQSEDVLEGRAAFLEKRSPNFKGR